MTTFAELKHCRKLGEMTQVRGLSGTDLVKKDVVARPNASLERVLKSERVHH